MTARAISRDGDPGELYRWALAGLIVLAAHLALVATLMLLHRPDAASSGAPVVLIELAPMPSAPAEQKLDLPPVPETVQPQPPSEPEVLSRPEPDVPPLPPEMAQSEPPPSVPEATPLLPLPPHKPVEPKLEQRAAAPKPREPQRKKPPAPRIAAGAPSPAAAPAAPQPGLSPSASAAESSWRDRLIAHLQRNKRYPDGAQSRREQGTAVLSFTIDRDGHVLARHIVRSSGISELDAEVLAMVQRAQPLPPFPPSMPQARMNLTVPIRFSLR